MAKQRIWKEMWDRALTSPYLLLLFVASILLSIASFYTTFVGITPFVEIPVFAFFITSAIQSLLFVVSWRIGFMFAGKEDVAGVDIGVFLVCFFLSVFFSFNSLFNVIFVKERQQDASLGRVRDGATEAVNDVDQLLKGIRTRLVGELRDSGDYTTWRADVLWIADAAQRTGPQLSDKVARQREEKQEQYERKEKDARVLAARKDNMVDEIAAKRHRLEALDATPPASNVEDLRQQVQELEVRISAKEAEMEAEAGGIGVTGKAGKGPKWTALDKERRVLVNQWNGAKEEFEIRAQQTQGFEQRRQALAKDLRETELLYENIDAEIERKQTEAEAAREELANFGSGGVGETVQALREYPNQFEASSDVTKLEQAEGLCTQLTDEMETLAVDLEGKSCDRGPIMDKVAPIIAINHALADLDEQCLGADAPSFHEKSLTEALAAARHCLDLSKLPYRQVRDLREVLDRLEREEGPNASEFTKTLNALFAGEKDGMLALVLAVSMDLLVLFTGLIGAKSATATFATMVLQVDRDDDPEVATIKNLLRHLDPFDQKIGGSRYVAKIDLEDVDDLYTRDLIAPLLVRNTMTGLVLASSEKPGMYFLRHDAREQLEEQLEKRQQDVGEYTIDPGAGRRKQSGKATSNGRRPNRAQTRPRFYTKGERAPAHPDPRRTTGMSSSPDPYADKPEAVPGSEAMDSFSRKPEAAPGSEAVDPYGRKPEVVPGSIAPDPYYSISEGVPGSVEPDVPGGFGPAPTSVADDAPVAPETPQTAAARQSPNASVPTAPQSGGSAGEPGEDLDLLYGFLNQNKPGKSPPESS